MGLSRTVSEINGDFRRKSPFFPPRVFTAPAEGAVNTRNRYRRSGQKKLEWWAFRRLKQFSDRFSRFDTIPACDGLTDTQPASHVAVASTRYRYAYLRRAVKMVQLWRGTNEVPPVTVYFNYFTKTSVWAESSFALYCPVPHRLRKWGYIVCPHPW